MIPKRAIGAIVTTAFALVLLFSFKTPAAPGLAASTTSETAIVGEPSATPTTETGSGSSSTTTQAGEDTGAVATPAPTDTATTTTDGAYRDGTVTGSVVSTRFGDVQVQVTISGGAIVDVAALQLPSGDRRSAQISSAVEPILREETLTAQSASIDLLSGATYTSRAYAQSLQTALDQAVA